MTHQYYSQIQEIPPLAKAIADKFKNLPPVLAVALAGSRTTGVSNQNSDYDFYVYIQEEIPVETRKTIAKEFAQSLEINNQFWETGDEWIDNKTGCGVDIMYRTPQWIEQQLEEVLIKHQASVGYSTCFLWNILTSANLKPLRTSALTSAHSALKNNPTFTQNDN